jgi:hypothetical protein
MADVLRAAVVDEQPKDLERVVRQARTLLAALL